MAAAAASPSPRGTPKFEGFSEKDIQVGRLNARLWKLEEENEKIREEIKGLVTLVRGWKGDKERGLKDMNDIVEELEELKGRELKRERENKKLREEVEKIVDLNVKYSEEIQELKKENGKLRSMVEKKEVRIDEGKIQSEVKGLVEKEVKSWKEEREQEKIDMTEIIRKQQEEHDKEMAKKVVKIIKEKDNIVRDTVQKKMCLMVFGDKEKTISNKVLREREELQRAKEIIGKIVGDETDIQIEEVYRIGKYSEGGKRPMKIRLNTQAAAEYILRRTSLLRKIEGMKDIYIRREMNEEERNKVKELKEEAKTKNEERTQEQAERYMWRVIDMKMRKWWLKNAEQEVRQQRENTKEMGPQ